MALLVGRIGLETLGAYHHNLYFRVPGNVLFIAFCWVMGRDIVMMVRNRRAQSKIARAASSESAPQGAEGGRGKVKL